MFIGDLFTLLLHWGICYAQPVIIKLFSYIYRIIKKLLIKNDFCKSIILLRENLRKAIWIRFKNLNPEVLKHIFLQYNVSIKPRYNRFCAEHSSFSGQMRVLSFSWALVYFALKMFILTFDPKKVIRIRNFDRRAK